ncbi:hypothetical protein J4E85_002542 [Alternaria conjuncta]|uniref:uncharacterized protein n=1 Tax=Alternaria conjuncta TaxID=181017 RepID=UPI00221EDFE4|nr:uncharacterized protein J4E85_002542 [Alternaria conjuncta]KAI4934684.1 hypothetical protein J4E85_002542 [Alternaria conjuncta]
MQRGFEDEVALANEPMITVKVDYDCKTVFMVPEDSIRASSEFVDAAMRGPWQESQQRSISLPEFGKQTFGVYFHWLLTGVVHSRQRCDYQLSALFNELLRLPALFDLGHYLLDTNFRDAVSDSLMQCASEIKRNPFPFPLDYASDFYKNVPSGSPTRKLVADLIAWTMDEHELHVLATGKVTMEPDLLLDILLAVGGRYITRPPSNSPFDGWKTSCKYHCHGDEKPCYRKKSGTYVVSFAHAVITVEWV